MYDGRSRVTVVGARNRVDVALPSAAPIGEYAAGLASLCGQPRAGYAPAAWSLAVAGAAPLDLTESLAGAGVVDGQVLYLRDIARDTQADPTVADFDELLAGEAGRQRATDWPRPVVLIAFGLVWLAVAAGIAVWRSPSPALAAVLVLVAAGLLLIGAGWGLAQRGTVVPQPLCVVTSLASVPCFGVAGALLAALLAGGDVRWVGALLGAAVAVLMALAATPEAVVVLLGLQVSAGLVLVPVLLIAHATGVQGAAATAVLMLFLLALAKRGAALVSVWTDRQSFDGTATAHTVTAVLVRSRWLMTALVTGPCLALIVALPVLAASRDWFAIGLAGASGVSLLVRAWQAGFANEWVPIGGTGLVAVFAVAGALVWTRPLMALVVLTVAGLILVAGGVVAAVLRPEPGAPDADVTGLRSGGGSRLRRVAGFVGLLGGLASAVLMLGVFGVFADLTDMGRSMAGR